MSDSPLTNGGPSAPLSVLVPEAVVEAIARRAAQLLSEGAPSGPERWLGVSDAARHLACPPSRIYALVHQRAIPFRKDGARLLFRASELDAWVESGGAKRR